MRRADPGHHQRHLLAVAPTDGRKGIDGLAEVVVAALSRDPTSGDRFVVLNHKGDRLKILAWRGDRFAMYLRRLESGTFAFPPATTQSWPSPPPSWPCPLAGVNPVDARQRARYARSAHSA